MSVRKIILVLLALVIAGGTVQITRTLIRQSRPAPAEATAPQPPKQQRVLVAAADLPAGTLVQPGQLRWRAWPEDDGIAKLYAVEGQRTAEEFQGSVVRQGIRVGEPITDGRVVKPGERGFLAAVLTPGARAVSIAVNGVTGVAGFIFPGDRVDVILTQALGRHEDLDKDRRASETVLRDVRVLALDQRNNDQKGEVKTAQTATLEVSPRQAEAVAVAAQMGALSLSLRSLAKPGEGVEMAAADTAASGGTATDAVTAAPTHTITWDSDVSLGLGAGLGGTASAAPPMPPPESTPSGSGAAMVKVQVVRGSTATEQTFAPR
ncbi:MAG TPA: Flp pilus assembly protein CpaB [Azospirillum sp.]|nr:Flp pilus assembly protein CpaB [Azospirillum sp.]